MIGIKGNGILDENLNYFTYGFDSKEEKVRANVDEIKKTIKEYGISGLVNHFIVKIPASFSENYSFRITNLQKESKLYQFINGEKSDFVNIYCYAFRMFLYLLVLACLIDQLRFKKIDYRIFFTISILGLIFFYAIWESKTDYSLPFISFMIILGAYILDKISNKKLDVQKKKLGKNVALVFVLFTIISFAFLYQGYVTKISTYHVYQVNNIYPQYNIYLDDLSINKKIIKQEFYANGKFNNISLAAIKYNDSSAKYDVRVYTKNKQVKSFIITSKDISNDGLVNLKLNEQNPVKKQKYWIVISSMDDDSDSIGWGYRLSRGNSQYDGDLLVNNKKVKSDLSMKVYYEYSGTYLSKLQYILLMLFTLLIEGIIIKNLFHNKN